MLPGSFNSSADVRELATYAVVNGIRREVESVTLDRELAGDLPDQVVSGGGVSGSGGTIRWSAVEDVTTREVSPWHKPLGWPPSSGDRVKVYVSDGVTSWPRFTGVIDKTTGTVGGGMQSTVIDDRDRLNAPFTHEAILRHHVPQAEGGAYRSVGLSHHYFLAAALRRAGVCNVPPLDAPVEVSVPLQGSVWPESGTVSSATGLVAGTHASFYPAPWGFSAGGFDASFTPRLNQSATTQVMLSMSVAADSAGAAYVDAMYGTDRLRLLVDADRTMKAYWGTTLVAQLSAQQMVSATRVSLRVRSGAWTLQNDQGQTATGVQSVSAAAMSLVRVYAAEGARIAAVRVDHPNSNARDRSYLDFQPNMRFGRNGLVSTMDMSPRIENRNVADLVDEICKATLTAAWWDESGVLQLIPSDQLRGGAPVGTITTLDDITALDWEDSLLSTRKQVRVSWKAPSISKGRSLRKELFRGPNDSMEANDTVEVFATPDASTEWLGPDRNPRRLDDTNWGVYNRKRGSFTGVYFMDANNNELPTASKPVVTTVEPIGTAAVKISYAAGALGAGVEANLGTSENASALRARLRGESLPVIRGFGEGVWIDEVTPSTITGPSWAPDLEHNLGHWGHRYFDGDSSARRVGDFIAQQVTTSAPTVTGVQVTYDPRRQLGDVVTIISGILDVTIRGLIVGINESHQPTGHSQELTIRVVSVTSSRRATYDELSAAWVGSDYSGLEAVWAGLTYDDFNRATP